ncbi:hypothetical protein X797_006687 [Metarhizium robertsii]|uniref:Uncharacterized protein n=2 Tax=Metarhizium robertsii TaxID=568076 RepID=E9ELL9_METRA|nr:uncharacterized protein MAA_01527 [Metarhizium robertsii ARSEF 23]EFZ04453.1 hypothetical protein MAA_01527 [Metarhizium robertsii ARSEF 23]EXV00240.1 hypothetical protein X797_006687 [Metarhizium robertsii]
MLALTILLSAAAGVNAIIGGEVKAVQISETQFICADNCVFGGIYLAQKGHYCPAEEVARFEKDGEVFIPDPYDCRGSNQATGYVYAPLKDEDKDKIENCRLHTGDATDDYACTANRIVDGGGTKILQLSEVVEMLKSTTANTADNNKPAPPKSKEECAQIARQKYLECHDKTGDFDECQNQGAEVFQNCRDGK